MVGALQGVVEMTEGSNGNKKGQIHMSGEIGASVTHDATTICRGT